MSTTEPRPLPPGVRGTRTRRRVLELLEQHDRPLTIPEILATDDSLAQSSVYRTLSILATTGAVQCVPATTPKGHAHYSVTPGSGTPVHRICNECSRIEHVGDATTITLALDGIPFPAGPATAIRVIAPCTGSCGATW
jgi:Fe2+ or Zn2+ uptake regulation protein